VQIMKEIRQQFDRAAVIPQRMLRNLTNSARLTVAGLALLWCSTVAASGISSEQADQILSELTQIKSLFEQQNADVPSRAAAQALPSRAAVVSLKDKNTLGNHDAPVVMVEFADYECPFCRRFHVESYPKLKEKYIDTGKVLFVSQDLPLGFHKNAMHAAHAGRCAGEQDNFWAFRDELIDNASQLSRADITSYAEKMNLDSSKLNKCIDSGRFQKYINSEVAEAGKIGITGTPSFVIGKRGNNQVSGQIIVGSKPIATFESLIDSLLGDDVAEVQPSSARYKLSHTELNTVEQN